MNILEKIDCVITALYCNALCYQYAYMGHGFLIHVLYWEWLRLGHCIHMYNKLNQKN